MKENAIENFFCEMAAILSRPQCVKISFWKYLQITKILLKSTNAMLRRLRNTPCLLLPNTKFFGVCYKKNMVYLFWFGRTVLNLIYGYIYIFYMFNIMHKKLEQLQRPRSPAASRWPILLIHIRSIITKQNWTYKFKKMPKIQIF